MHIPLATRPPAGFRSTQSPILQTTDLAVGYTGKPPRRVAQGISASLKAGELVCLIGPNGAGKSTLLRTLAGMQPPLSGRVTLLGDDVQQLAPRDLAQRLSVVLTERVNPGLLTAYALVALGRHPYTDWSGRLTADDEAIVRDALTAVGAKALIERQVGELSDGERQKIMIARALAQQPALMILDEPTAFLDLPRRVEIMQLLRRLAHEQKRAILLSTHDLDLALRTADQIWLLPAGRDLHVGAPEDLVLSGAFELAFQAEGVRFDPQTGAFRISSSGERRIALSGSGLPAIWTQRALERVGYTVAEDGDRCVEVAAGRWRLLTTDGAQTFDSLAALVEAVGAFN